MRSSANAKITPEESEEEPLSLDQPEPESEPEPEVAVEAPEPTPAATTNAEALFPLAEPGEYYIGLWSGLPNYGCPYCTYATLEGSGAVELHILSKIEQGHPRHLRALELK